MTKYLLVFVFCFSGFVSGQEKGQVMLLAEFISSTYVENNSYRTEDGGAVIMPSIYAVSFNIVERLESEEEFEKKTLDFKLKIRSDYPLSRSNGFVLIVEQNEDEAYTLVDWTFISRTFCIDKTLIKDAYKDFYFKGHQEGNENEMCRFI